jgi:hypothetical protein
MHIISSLYNIDKCVSAVKEEFRNNNRNWEVIDNLEEKATLENGHYNMINRSERSWHYYKTKSGLKKEGSFLLDALIELKSRKDCYGHFGLLWGFDDDMDSFNRFTLSADGKRALVMQFDKDHNEIYHRFQTRKLPAIHLSRPVRFTIFKLGEYYYFSVNGTALYSAHEYHFAQPGKYIGYYVEPGLEISSPFLEIKRLKIHSVKTNSGLHQLMTEGDCF